MQIGICGFEIRAYNGQNSRHSRGYSNMRTLIAIASLTLALSSFSAYAADPQKLPQDRIKQIDERITLLSSSKAGTYSKKLLESAQSSKYAAQAAALSGNATLAQDKLELVDLQLDLAETRVAVVELANLKADTEKLISQMNALQSDKQALTARNQALTAENSRLLAEMEVLRLNAEERAQNGAVRAIETESPVPGSDPGEQTTQGTSPDDAQVPAEPPVVVPTEEQPQPVPEQPAPEAEQPQAPVAEPPPVEPQESVSPPADQPTPQPD
jgi:hypothetical protein